MAKVMVLVQGPAYGDERAFNGLRLAGSLSRREGVEVKVFLLGDAVGCAVAGQQVPNGYYHLDRMVEVAARHGAEVGCCGTCMDARGLKDEQLTGSSRRSTLEELTDWTLWADQVVTF
ncbi:MAG: DsrE family protein [Acidimicrobiia bacterium]|nr:DsrE family protein [Acidimicrobiia bacterium]